MKVLLRDRILNYVVARPGADDDEISVALAISPRQTVNQICRELVGKGLVRREIGNRGKIVNFPLVPPVHSDQPQQSKVISEPIHKHGAPATDEWFWEGNVCDRLAASLVDRGWIIESKADTRARERGFDLHVRRNECEIIFEVKGFPSTSYRDPARSSEKKRTPPSLQAQHWYAGGIMQAFRIMSKSPSAICALALPDIARYRRLFEETAVPLMRAGLSVVFVGHDGELSAVGFPVSLEE